MVAWTLHTMPFSKSGHFDGLLRFNLANQESSVTELEKILNGHCQYFALVTMREMAQGERLDYAYQVKLKKDTTYNNFVKKLQDLNTIKGLKLLLQETTVEV